MMSSPKMSISMDGAATNRSLGSLKGMDMATMVTGVHKASRIERTIDGRLDLSRGRGAAASPSRLDEKEITTQATLLTATRSAAHEAFDIAPAFARQKALVVRSEQHTKVQDELDEAGAGIEEMLHQSRRSKETLKALELKLQRLRGQLRPSQAAEFEVGPALSKKRAEIAPSKKRAAVLIAEQLQ